MVISLAPRGFHGNVDTPRENNEFEGTHAREGHWSTLAFINKFTCDVIICGKKLL